MDDKKNISLSVIKRLPRYYRYLGDLLDNNITRISSKELSKRMNITASQIRQDLNNFGCFGQQGYGYNVEVLYSEIRKILGLDKSHNLIIIGAGKIGQAIINYTYFERRGFDFIAMFDTRQEIVGKTIGQTPVYHIDQLKKFTEENRVDIAVLTVPKQESVKIFATLSKSSIKGIWNFSPVDFEASAKLMVENVHLTDSLMTLSYKLNEEDIIGKCRL